MVCLGYACLYIGIETLDKRMARHASARAAINYGASYYSITICFEILRDNVEVYVGLLMLMYMGLRRLQKFAQRIGGALRFYTRFIHVGHIVSGLYGVGGIEVI